MFPIFLVILKFCTIQRLFWYYFIFSLKSVLSIQNGYLPLVFHSPQNNTVRINASLMLLAYVRYKRSTWQLPTLKSYLTTFISMSLVNQVASKSIQVTNTFDIWWFENWYQVILSLIQFMMKAINNISFFPPLRTLLFENNAACTASCTSHVGAQTPTQQNLVLFQLSSLQYIINSKNNIFKLSPLR